MNLEDYIEAKWQAYLAQPSNFGADDRATRLAEEDAYKAGARDIYFDFVPF